MKEKVMKIRKNLIERIEEYSFYVKHNRWVDDGKGGCINCKAMLSKYKAQLEIIDLILKP